MNNTGVTVQKAEAKRDILFATNPVVAIGVIVNADGLTADTNGVKKILAGQALGGTTSALTDRQTELSLATDSTAQGVTQHDIIFPVGKTTANANMIIFGFVDTNKMEPAAAPSTNVISALKGAVTFVDGK
jgi:hypothetical protein